MTPRLDKVPLLEAVDKISPLALVLVLCAVGLSVLVAFKARDVASLLQATHGPARKQAASIARQYYSATQYAQAAARLSRSHPGVQIEPSKDGASLRISISDSAQYPAWLFALYALQGPEKGLAWEAEALCLGSCSEGAAASASVKAFVQTLKAGP